MALAGPTANFLLVFLAVLLIQGGIRFGLFQAPGGLDFARIVDATNDSMEGPARFLSILFSLNLLLGTFNLLPVPPLDGHSAIGLALPQDLFRRWLELVRSPMFSLLGLLIAWRYFYVLFEPVFFFALRLL
jgi:Zn-dependent protease